MAKGEPWADRIERVHREFPSTQMNTEQWKDAFRKNDDLMAAFLLVLDQSVQPHGRRGHRAMPDKREFWDRTRQLFFGDDFTVRPFHEAFQTLAGDRSLAHIEGRTGINKSRIRYLLKGERPDRPAPRPTAHDMEMIAKAFGKLPSYFVEYRNGVVLAAMRDQLEKSPETSVGLVRRLGLEPV